jgi:UDP-2,3-diacylglucosamine pyrophosphatase LpxH
VSARLLVLSDLHLEFGPFVPHDPALYDIVVLAGDTCAGVKAVHWAQRESTFARKPLLLVPGNHEFYGVERTRALAQMREQAAGTNVHVLDRDEVVLHGIRFVGATLWTDFALDVARGTPVQTAMADARQGLTDFRAIKELGGDPVRGRPFMPLDALREHRLSRAWLQARLNAPIQEGMPIVVVTHHGPSARSMDPMYAGSNLNPCFYSELPDTFFQTAALWVHGHTHSSSDYVHHRTRVVANPRGYMRRDGANENPRFDPRLVISLELEAHHG